MMPPAAYLLLQVVAWHFLGIWTGPWTEPVFDAAVARDRSWLIIAGAVGHVLHVFAYWTHREVRDGSILLGVA